jgi:hypothetical protein
MGVPDRIAPQRAVVAKGGRPLEVPSSHFEPGGLVGVNAGGADIHQVSGKRAFELTVRKPAEVETVADLHGTEVPVPGKFAVKPGTAVAVDAAVHFMLNVRSQVLVPVRSLAAPIPADAVSAGPCFILQQALAALVAYGTIQWMIHHQQFDYPFAKLNRLFVGRRNDHPIPGFDHTTHLNALERPLDKFDGAHTAGADGPQRLVIAEARDHNAQPFGGFDDTFPPWDLDFKIVNDQPWHGTDILFG